MGLFAEGVKNRIIRDGIVVRDVAHQEELYVKYRDEIFMDRFGMTYMEWFVLKVQQKANK